MGIVFSIRLSYVRFMFMVSRPSEWRTAIAFAFQYAVAGYLVEFVNGLDLDFDLVSSIIRDALDHARLASSLAVLSCAAATKFPAGFQLPPVVCNCPSPCLPRSP